MTYAAQRGLQYFESDSMNGLYERMTVWMAENKIEQFSSMTIQQDKKKFCCLAITDRRGPIDVSIHAGIDGYHARVRNGCLMVHQSG